MNGNRTFVAIVLAVCVSFTGVTARQDLGVPSKDGLVVCTSAPACDAGAAVMAGGGQCR